MNSTVSMIYREANLRDIPGIQKVRNAVKENRLSDPALVSDNDCKEFIGSRGKGWVCENSGMIAGFAIIDLRENNVWALFVHPDFEKQGIGRTLQKLMLDWFFYRCKTTIWLGTAPGTRAEGFYRSSGWRHTGNHGEKEIKFEMNYEDYLSVFG